MTPYDRKKSFKGKFIYSDMGWKKYGITAWYSFLILISMAITVLKQLQQSFNVLNSMVTTYLITQMIFGIFSIHTFAARASYLLEAYANCYRAEKTLKRLGFHLDYKTVHKITLYGSMLTVLFSVMNLILHLLWKKSILEFIRFSAVYSLPCVIIVIPVYHFFYLGNVVIRRLKTINTYLEEDFPSTSNQRIQFDLWSLAYVHSELCNSINNVLYACAFSTLTFYFFTYIQFSVFVLAVLDVAHLELDAETYVWNFIYISTTITILVLATLLKYEVSKTAHNICELTSAFFDDSIGTRRNTFLLQMLHQRINLKIYGYFEVHLSRVLTDLQALVNLLMFVTQFKH